MGLKQTAGCSTPGTTGRIVRRLLQTHKPLRSACCHWRVCQTYFILVARPLALGMRVTGPIE